jgi:predicted RNA binding protein YcfA (HicA-like mRNA interferase family)
MPKLIVLSGNELIKILEFMGFGITRIHGSHYRLKCDDGRAATVPVHGNNDLPKGLLRKIIREDLEMELEDFNKVINNYKNSK